MVRAPHETHRPALCRHVADGGPCGEEFTLQSRVPVFQVLMPAHADIVLLARRLDQQLSREDLHHRGACDGGSPLADTGMAYQFVDGTVGTVRVVNFHERLGRLIRPFAISCWWNPGFVFARIDCVDPLTHAPEQVWGNNGRDEEETTPTKLG